MRLRYLVALAAFLWIASAVAGWFTEHRRVRIERALQCPIALAHERCVIWRQL